MPIANKPRIMNVPNNRPVKVWDAGDGDVMLINRDLTNNINIAFEVGVSNSNEAILLDALSAQWFDGTEDLWVQAIAGTPQLQVAPKLKYWAPSPALSAAQINTLGLAKDSTVSTVATNTTGVAKDSTVNTVATNTTGVSKDSSLTTINSTLGTPAQDSIRTAIPTNISTTGVPLLILATNNINQQSQTLTAGATYTSATITITQISYDFSLSMQAAAGSTSPFFRVQFNWVDVTTGLTVARDHWWVASSASTSTDKLRYRGKGVTKGNQLVITILSNDTVSTTFDISFTQNSRVIVRDDIRSINMAVQIPGFSAAGMAEGAGIICSTAPSVTNGTTVTRVLALYSGLCSLNVTPPATQTFTVQIQTLALFNSDGGGAMPALNVYSNSNPAAGTSFNTTVTLPRAVCVIQIQNTGSAAATWSAEMVAQEAND